MTENEAVENLKKAAEAIRAIEQIKDIKADYEDRYLEWNAQDSVKALKKVFEIVKGVNE